MKKTVVVIVLLAIGLLAGCDGNMFASAESLQTQATNNLQQRNFAIAAALADQLIRKAPDGYAGYFLLAQARTQLGETNAALAALESAIKHGDRDGDVIEQNENLQPLHGKPAYRELLDKAFPKRAAVAADDVSAGSVGIVKSDDKTVIHAGSVTVELPH